MKHRPPPPPVNVALDIPTVSAGLPMADIGKCHVEWIEDEVYQHTKFDTRQAAADFVTGKFPGQVVRWNVQPRPTPAFGCQVHPLDPTRQIALGTGDY